MSDSANYQLTVPVAGRRVLVVGAGTAAIGHIAALHQAGAKVTVIASTAVPAVADLADRGLIEWRSRTWAADDLADYWFVVIAIADRAEVEQLMVAADRHRVLACSVVNDAAGSATQVAEPPIGTVYLVGGGPGDPGLLTVAGARVLAEADVIVCDRLAPIAALVGAKSGAEVIDVSKIPRGEFTPQEEINRILVRQALLGKTVVRLKGGDNFVFGRGGEEWQACLAAGVSVRVIPGVSSAIAVPGLAGIPATHRGLNQGFSVISGHLRPGDPQCTVDYPGLVKGGTDLIFLMAVANLSAITEALLAGGIDPHMPAVTVADGGLPTQRVIYGDVSSIAAQAYSAGIKAPAITVIGRVAGFKPSPADPAAAGAVGESLAARG